MNSSKAPSVSPCDVSQGWQLEGHDCYPWGEQGIPKMWPGKPQVLAAGCVCPYPSRASELGLPNACPHPAPEHGASLGRVPVLHRAPSSKSKGVGAERAQSVGLRTCGGWKCLGSGIVPCYLLVARPRCTTRPCGGRAVGAGLLTTVLPYWVVFTRHSVESEWKWDHCSSVVSSKTKAMSTTSRWVLGAP